MRRAAKRILTAAAAVIVTGSFFADCTSKEERLEKQEAYRKIGITAMEDGDYAAAMEAFNHALEQAKGFGANEVDICYYKAAAQFMSGTYHGAIETYDALLDYDDESSDTYFLRGCVYLKNNESAKAEEDFKSAVQYAENDEIYLLIYNALKGVGFEKEGRAYLEEALANKAGNDAKNYTVKGRIYMIKEQYKKATEELTTAIQNGDVEANLYLAQTYEALEKPDLAEACIDAYVKVYPKSSVAYNQLGCKALEAQNYEDAISYFNQGLALDEVTNEQQLRSNLIAAYEYSGDFVTAKAKMQEYKQDYPNDSAANREYWFLDRKQP